ncbi:MAG: bifunctional (p)ppGpp synthetase/guanosine-3',5'-bis(diphosphate) 3'-pyrophosphohydrolase [Paludibacteraceae bacterium]|nr:bifunctional (p)ppGpp synthetase/guanosine-3',5'-bis(diphosphate) 3'-pyrophosphohydrolase [Paludibacteraceae bacterium]
MTLDPSISAIYTACGGNTSPDNLDYTRSLEICRIAQDEIGVGKTTLTAIMLYPLLHSGVTDMDTILRTAGEDTAMLLRGIHKVQEIYDKAWQIDTDNFKHLLLSLAKDVRVIFIKLASRLYYIRNIETLPLELRPSVLKDTACIYAPLAHKMGLYGIKTEMEDLCLKYTNPTVYYDIAKKLSETKSEREAYIVRFIKPIKERMEAEGLKFHIKGRTKSIHSIYNKIKNKHVTFENIFDLFAIRVILDSAPDAEQAECWKVYSIVTDMYKPDTSRLRDWISNPKENGYESLHTTVEGPEDKWVEVQIRTERMDVIAEKGLAAHWRYKGIEGEKEMDAWLSRLRTAIEEGKDSASTDAKDEFKMDLYDKDVYVFTPKGELICLPKGATILDFAYSVHTKVGNTCVGGKVGGKNVTMRYVLQNGDQVEVLTSSTQQPRADWINIAVTSKARQRIRQVIKEYQKAKALEGMEITERRFKNWKMDFDEARFYQMGRKLGYRNTSDIFIDIATGKVDITSLKDLYINFDHKEETEQKPEYVPNAASMLPKKILDGDILIVGSDTKGVQLNFAKCCHPVPGDEIFGFISALGGLKIHKADCPNAKEMKSRYPYRIKKAKWR